MSIRRKELPRQQKEKEPMELQLLATFPRPPPGPRSPARLSLQSPGLTPRPSNYGFISTNPTDKEIDADADSLYDEPGPPSPSISFPAAPSSGSDAELQLVLDHPSKVYSPGGIITGYIIGWPTPEEHVHIILLGQSITSLKDTKTVHTDRAPLLFQVTHVKPRVQTSIPRFEISIPPISVMPVKDLNDFTPKDRTGRSYWTTTWPIQDSFEHEASHPLPPSMHMGPHSASTLFNVYGRASISYSLIAVRSLLDSSTKSFVPNATFRLPLTLITRLLPPPKIDLLKREICSLATELTVQTAALAKERKLRLREQLCDAFNTSAPTFYFSVKVTVPKLSTPGADLKIRIGMEVLPPQPGHSYNFPVPDIVITRITVRLRSYTGVRVLVASAPSHPASSSPGMVSKKETFRHTEFRQTQTPRNATFRPQNGGFEGQVCVTTVPLPQALTPSFKTYNAWRGYRVECTITLRVAGKAEEAKVTSDLDIVVGEDPKIQRIRIDCDPLDNGMTRRIAEVIVRLGAAG